MIMHPPGHFTADPFASAGQVARLLPATAPKPEPARRVNFLKALLLFWLMPKRYGPHLAVASLWRALAAHILGVLFVLGLIFIEPVTTEFRAYLDRTQQHSHKVEGHTIVHHMRVAAACNVLQLAAWSAQSPWGQLSALSVLGSLFLTELAVMLLAVVAMPWCAGGDRAVSVFNRSLKNVYWSTIMLAPASIIIWVVIVQAGKLREWFILLDNMAVDSILICLFGLPLLFLLRSLIVGASRYVGEPSGPAFAPREPQCDQCGYLIIGLPLEADCPECGTPVRDSLPGGRRRPTDWQQNELRPRGLLELLRTQWRVLRSTQFFRELPVREGLPAARHFWWGTFWIMVLTMILLVRLIHAVVWGGEVFLGSAWAALSAVIAPFVAQSLMMFAACLWAQLGYGIRDYRISAIVCYYASPLMWPLMFVLLIGSLFLITPQGLGLLDTTTIRFAGLVFDGWMLALSLVVVLTVPALWFWWRQLLRALAAVRYANV